MMDKDRMLFKDYQEEAHLTAMYEDPHYPVFGLMEEAGEVCRLFAKRCRGDSKYLNEVFFRDSLIQELGDVLWMLSEVADSNGIELEVIAKENLFKLRDRMTRGVIKGDGDIR